MQLFPNAYQSFFNRVLIVWRKKISSNYCDVLELIMEHMEVNETEQQGGDETNPTDFCVNF